MYIYTHLSNEEKPGCSGYRRDYTTQMYGDYNKPLYGSLLDKQTEQWKVTGFFSSTINLYSHQKP